MASDYETGFYLDGGYYDGQIYLGTDFDDVMESDADMDEVIYDHIYVDWDNSREWFAHAVAYEGLLETTMDELAEEALRSIRDNTTRNRGPVFGKVYWWDESWSDAPRPPPEPLTKETVDARPKASKCVRSAKAPARRSAKKAPAKSGNARPKARPKARKPATKKATARKPVTRRR